MGTETAALDTKSFVERLVGPLPAHAESRENVEPADSTCFKAVPEVHHPLSMLVLRLRTGNAKAIGYGYLVDVDFDPSVGITLSFVGHKVVVRGRHLGRLFDKLSDHRVEWMREHDETAPISESSTLISSISISPV